MHTVCREPSGSVLSRNKEHMVKWLKGLTDREEVRLRMCAFFFLY